MKNTLLLKGCDGDGEHTPIEDYENEQRIIKGHFSSNRWRRKIVVLENRGADFIKALHFQDSQCFDGNKAFSNNDAGEDDFYLQKNSSKHEEQQNQFKGLARTIPYYACIQQQLILVVVVEDAVVNVIRKKGYLLWSNYLYTIFDAFMCVFFADYDFKSDDNHKDEYVFFSHIRFLKLVYSIK